MIAPRPALVALCVCLLAGCFSSLRRPSVPARLAPVPPGSCVYLELHYGHSGFLSYRRETAADVRARCDDERVCTAGTDEEGVVIRGLAPGRTTVRVSFRPHDDEEREEHAVEVAFGEVEGAPPEPGSVSRRNGCLNGHALGRGER